MPSAPAGRTFHTLHVNINRMSTVGIIDFELSSGRNQSPMVLVVELASRTDGPHLQLGMYDWSCLCTEYD
jgi:hypothetical protein